MLGGYFGDCEMPVDLRLPCTTVRERAVTELGLLWDVLPGGAAAVCNGHAMGRWDFGPGLPSLSLPNSTKVGSAWKKELHLQQAIGVHSQGGHMELTTSEVIVFILMLEFGCIFYCYSCLSQFFRNAHTRQSFRIKWKTE